MQTIPRGSPIPAGLGGWDTLAQRIHEAANEAVDFVRESAEAEEAARRQFLLAASLGNGATPVTFMKGDGITVADIVFEAIEYDRELQREAMQLILTLARGDCQQAKLLLQRAALLWAQQNAKVAA